MKYDFGVDHYDEIEEADGTITLLYRDVEGHEYALRILDGDIIEEYLTGE